MRAKRTDRDRYLDPGEFRSLLEAASEDPRAYTLLALAGNLGLRVGEAVRLRLEDVQETRIAIPTLKKDGLTKREKRAGHTSRGRIRRNQLPRRYESLPLPEEISDLLQEWIRTSRPETWVFPGRAGHLSERTAERLFERYRGAAGLNGAYSFHALRHTRGMAVQRRERDILAVKTALRHSNLRSSAFYVSMDEEEKRKMFGRVGTVLPTKKKR